MNKNIETLFDAGEYVGLEVETKKAQYMLRQTHTEGGQQGYLLPNLRALQI
jgi:hypothetical protein